MPTVKPKSISQHKMRRFLELQAQAKEFEDLKEEIKGMLKAKAPQQPGRYQVSISHTPGRRTPPWKEEYIKVMTSCHRSMGDDPEVARRSALDDADRVVEKTKPGKPSFSIKVIDTDELI